MLIPRKTALLSAFLFLSGHAFAAGCDFEAMRSQAVRNFGMSAHDARVYSLAFENLLANLDRLQVRLDKGIYQVDLKKLESDLIQRMGVDAWEARYLLDTIRMVRGISGHFGMTELDPACTGSQ